MRTSRQTRAWLAEVPTIELLTPEERRNVGTDLLHLCEQLLEEVRARSSAGGIAVGVSFAGGMLSLIFPPAAPAVLVGTLVIGGAFASNAYQQLRRQQELDGVIKLMRNLGWTLRQ